MATVPRYLCHLPAWDILIAACIVNNFFLHWNKSGDVGEALIAGIADGHLLQRESINPLCLLVWKEIKVLDAGGADQVLQPAKLHFHSLAVALPELGQQLHHFTKLSDKCLRSYYPQNEIYTHHIYLRISHIIFRNKDGEGWPPQQAPVFVDEPQLLSDVLGEQSHVMVQVEVRGREDDGIA